MTDKYEVYKALSQEGEVLYVGSVWVYNRAAEYGFGITPEALKSYFV